MEQELDQTTVESMTEEIVLRRHLSRLQELRFTTRPGLELELMRQSMVSLTTRSVLRTTLLDSTTTVCSTILKVKRFVQMTHQLLSVRILQEILTLRIIPGEALERLMGVLSHLQRIVIQRRLRSLTAMVTRQQIRRLYHVRTHVLRMEVHFGQQRAQRFQLMMTSSLRRTTVEHLVKTTGLRAGLTLMRKGQLMTLRLLLHLLVEWLLVTLRLIRHGVRLMSTSLISRSL